MFKKIARKDFRSGRGLILIAICGVLLLSILSCQAPVGSSEPSEVVLEATDSPTQPSTPTPALPSSTVTAPPTQTPVIPQATETELPGKPATVVPTVTPSDTPMAPVASFSNSSWLTVPPDDILEQLAYGGVGGGGGDGGDEDICEEVLAAPEIAHEYREEIELFQGVWITICGLTPKKNVRIGQVRPDGETVIVKEKADPSGGLVYKFETTFGDPVGGYSIECASKSADRCICECCFEPDGTRLIELEDEALILLYNFDPGERVRLFVFTHQERVSKLYAWQELQVDAKGQMLVEMELPPPPGDTQFFSYYTYLAIGERSESYGKDLLYFPCPGAMRPRLSIEMPSRVTYTDGRPLRVRRKPGFSGAILRQIPEGYEMYISGGPRCVDGVYWWRVYIEGKQGWVAEGEDGMYYVEPWFGE